MSPNDIVLEITLALDKLHIPYMLVGSFAANIYGSFSATYDTTIVLQLDDQPITAITHLLGTDFQLDPQRSFETSTGTACHSLVYQQSAFTVQLFLLSSDPHDQMRFARRRETVFANRRVFVPTVEDVIITKLRWSKAGNRRKDVEDVENIIAVQTAANLDLPYIRQWCDQHGTRELFERLLAAAPAE